MAKLVVASILCVLSVMVSSSYASGEDSVEVSAKNIIVEIDYGGLRPSRTIETPRVEGRTALEVLQSVAEVKTHPVGEYVFVTSVDGVEGKRGEMAWYYTVDGKSADKLAYSAVLDNTSCVKWEYKKDICSGTVDKCE
ncbi:MAG: DUF4430 domain-containing protein [Candidatus Omnitrophota bacterium]